MNETNSTEKEEALEELLTALNELLTKDTLPLRDKALALAVIEKIESGEDVTTTRT